MAFAFEVVKTVRRGEPTLIDAGMEQAVRDMLDEAIARETQFAEDLLGEAWPDSRWRPSGRISSSAPTSGWPPWVGRVPPTGRRCFRRLPIGQAAGAPASQGRGGPGSPSDGRIAAFADHPYVRAKSNN